MSRAVRMLIIGALGALTLGALTGSAQAGIWTPIPSGTTGQINAIEYQSPSRLWYATTGGQLAFRNPDGSFGLGTGPVGPIQFNDIAFQAAGLKGVAVGNGNNVWHTVDGGHVWSHLVIPPPIDNDDCFGDAPVGTSPFDIGFSVTYADENTVYITGDRGNILKSGNGGDSFVEINKKLTDDDGTACRVTETVNTDVFFFDANNGFFLSRDFGRVSQTDNGLSGNALPRDEAINNFTGVPRFTWDRANPSRGWAVDRCLDCFYSTEDGGDVFKLRGIGGPEVLPEGSPRIETPQDIASAGGTVVVAGSAGQILNSIDGKNFFFQPADAPNGTRDWKAVDVADGANAAVGGANGALVVSTAANTIPDITKPTGTISGPATANAGAPVSFTLNAADTGGSGLNPASFAWTSAGLPGRSGQTISYTFPSPGFYTVKVTFADNAGNTGEATKSISVSRAAAAPALPVSFSGPGNTLTARIRGSRIIVTMRGTIKPPAGSNVRAACRGKVNLQVKKGRRNMVSRTVKLKLKKGKCRFSKRLSLSRKKVGKTKKLKLRVSFRGNTVLKAGSKTVTLIIRR